MSPETRPTRRRFLAAGGTALAALAGCTGDGATPAQDRDTTTPTASDGTTMTPELDLREANVVGVAVERQGGSVSFDVTLHHDDDGEDGYANWWQVETLDGERLGRRVLTHPHSRQPFTRSDTYEIPAETTCVVVRGHDQTHGYGGQAMVVSLDTGATRAVRQGSEQQSLSDAACP
ncbi:MULTISPECIES: hypothetical protein [Salinibaculum]|uniref:hypothetical protein n=1 Tax=Salinibaculum TaxID=2732368 RepID=UPI0030D3A9AA